MSVEHAIPASTTALARIRALAPSLPPSDRRAAEVISTLAEDTLNYSITQIAESANVAESTVIRACKRLGFSGFHDLKLTIAREGTPRLHMVADALAEDETTDTIVAKLFASSAAVLAEAATSVDTAALEALVESITRASRILVVGLGPSSSVAQDAAYRLRSIGLGVDAPIDALTQHLAAGLLRPGDVCLAVSHTGATRETLETVGAAHAAGATTGAITSFARSPLTRAVDHSIIAGGKQLGFRVEAMASRFAHLCVLDALYVALAMHPRIDAQPALDIHHTTASRHQL